MAFGTTFNRIPEKQFPANITALIGQHATVGTQASKGKILNSWKEIATHFDRGVRTVQRWEHDLALPVHRIGKGVRSPVFANIAELDSWLIRTGEKPAESRVTGWETANIQMLRSSRLEMRELNRHIAENTRDLKRVGESLRATVLRAMSSLEVGVAPTNALKEQSLKCDRAAVFAAEVF